MIKISGKHITDLADRHRDSCKPETILKLEFLIDLFGVLAGKKMVKINNSLIKDYKLTETTIFMLVNPFLKPNFKKSSKQYKIDINSCSSMMFSGTKSKLNYSYRFDWSDYYDFYQKIKNNIDDILCGKPSILFAKIISDSTLDIQSKTPIKPSIEYLFKYEKLIGKGFPDAVTGKKWNSYVLTKELNVNVCPYCNKNWINTVIGENGKKITNPQLDHFFFKAQYPLLRLSFYNLIPSCETCNARIKKSELFKFNTHLHPYDNGFGNVSSFRAKALDTASTEGTGKNYRIKLKHSKDTRDVDLVAMNKVNYKFFKIKKIYQEHGDIISEIFFIRKKNNGRYLTNMLKERPYLGSDIADVYRVAFGNYYNEEDHIKRPFAKLTRDIVEQKKLI